MLRKIILTGIGLLFVGASRFGFNLASIHALGEEITGTLNLIFSTALLIGLPTAAFSNAATVRFIARSRGEGRHQTADWIYRRLYIANAISVIGCIGLLEIFSEQAASWLNLETSSLSYAYLIAIAYVFYQFARHSLYAGDRVGVATILEIVSGLCFFASLGLMILTNAGNTIVLCFAMGYLVFVIGSSWTERQRLLSSCPKSEKIPTPEIMSFSVLALLGTTASMSVNELAIIFAGEVSDLSGAAFMGLCASALVALQLLPRMLRTVLFAESSELDGTGNHEKLAVLTTECNHWILLINIPVCVSMAIIAGPILELMGTEVTAERILAFQFLIGSSLVAMIGMAASNVLPGIGDLKTPVIASVSGLLLTLGIWWFTTEQWGLVALAFGLFANAIVKSAIAIKVLKGRMPVSMSKSPRTILALTIASGIFLEASQRLPGSTWFLVAGYLTLTVFLTRKNLVELASLVQVKIQNRAPQS
jgi:O-antigen/teichoic acid export membrane protein